MADKSARFFTTTSSTAAGLYRQWINGNRNDIVKSFLDSAPNGPASHGLLVATLARFVRKLASGPDGEAEVEAFCKIVEALTKFE